MKTILFALLLAMSQPAIAAERAIDESVVVKAPIAKVWEAWTTSAGIKTFFAPDAKIEARVDGPHDWTARMEQLRKMQEKK